MSVITRLHARDLFQGLNPEQEQPSNRIIEVRAGSVLEQLVKQFEEYLAKGTLWDAQQNIIQIGRSQSGIRASDIEQLSIILGRYDDQIMFEFDAGEFLTKCFNVCKDDNISVYTMGWKSPAHAFSLNNRKNVIIYGDVGNSLGRSMTHGKITVNGNAGTDLGGNMSGGEIYINGNFENLGLAYNRGGAIYHRGRQIVRNGGLII